MKLRGLPTSPVVMTLASSTRTEKLNTSLLLLSPMVRP